MDDDNAILPTELRFLRQSCQGKPQVHTLLYTDRKTNS
jgi:hypothetical protein